MKINKSIAIVVMLLGLLVGSLGAGVFLGQRPFLVNAALAAQEEDDDADEAGDVEDDDDDTDEADDVEDDDEDEANVSPDQTGITAAEARAAAEAANPGAKAVEVELENENGTIFYEVEMDNDLEVMVDAANGNILGTEQD